MEEAQQPLLVPAHLRAQGAHAERVQVRGWGVDAIVSNFDEAALDRLRAVDGVENVEADAMPLEEIFLAIAGEPAKSGDQKEREGGAAA